MYLHIDSKSLLHHCRAASFDWLVPELCRVLRICCLLPFQLLNSLVRSTKFCTLQGKLKIMKHQHQHFPTVADVQEKYGKLSPNFPKISTRFYKCFWIFFSLMQRYTVFVKGTCLATMAVALVAAASATLATSKALVKSASNLLIWASPQKPRSTRAFWGKKLTYADKKWRKIRKNPWNNYNEIR